MEQITDPRQPASKEVITLTQAQRLRPIDPEQGAPMRFEDLHASLRPALPLLFEGREAVWCEAFAHHLIDIDGAQVLLHQSQPKLCIFTQTPFRPAAMLFERLGSNHGHGAVLDDGISLVAMVHSNPEKTIVFPIHHFPEHTATPIAMGLRCLHDTYLGIRKISNQST